MQNRTEVTNAELHELLATHPADEAPLEHATARFHLGTSLISSGEIDEAQEHLTEAARVFQREGERSDEGKAVNMLGVALRDAGRTEQAAAAFATAAQIFDEEGDVAECGAALYNLGLAKRDTEDPEAAIELFSAAATIFEEAGVTAQTSAARRELGTTLLGQGEHERAREVLAEAVAWGRTAGDLAALGYASTMLGLTYLAMDRCDEAIAALRDAVGAHPRNIRGEAYAVAKANLAVAYERGGDTPRARLSARQVLVLDDVPESAREVAQAVLDRRPGESGDLARVLVDEPRERWEGLVREEVIRWVETDEETRRAEVGAWMAAVAEDREQTQDLLEAWFGAMLELPPESMDRLVASTVIALGQLPPEVGERFPRDANRAMARFHTPQMMRLQSAFEETARTHDAGTWP